MIFRRVAARSISMCETPPPAKRFFRSRFSLRSSARNFGKFLLRKPVRVPIFVVSDPKSVWMNFLSHNFLLLSFEILVFIKLRFIRGLGLVFLGLSV